MEGKNKELREPTSPKIYRYLQQKRIGKYFQHRKQETVEEILDLETQTKDW